jgi:dienelactone hydrolase
VFNVGFRSPDQEPMERNVDLSTLVPRLATVLANAPQEVLQELENPFQTLQRFGRTANLLEQLDDPLELLNPLGSPFDPFEATVVSELLNELDRFWLLGDVESVPRVLGVGNWREHAQALALSDRDVSEFGADIDFGKLRETVTERNVPDAGILSLLYPSRYYLGEGTDTDHDVLEGRIQPYSAYVPADLEEPAPMVMRLYSLSCSYTQYAVYTPNPVKRISEPNNAVVLMPQARDPGRWYQREAELDVFEAWRDLEGRIDIDRSRVTLGGYSMGGFGTCVLAAQCPDLFGRGFSVVGPPTEDPIEGITGGLATAPPSLTTNLFGGEGGGQLLNVFTEGPSSALEITANLRHVPMLIWNGAGDPLVPIISPDNYARRLRKHGYRHQFDVFTAETHLSFGVRDRWTGIPEFVARSKVIRNPRRVTDRHLPEPDHPEVDLVHDGAYWVSDIRTRDDRSSGLVDAVSYAEGYAPPEVGTFTEYGREPRRHLSRGVQWGSAPGPAPRTASRSAWRASTRSRCGSRRPASTSTTRSRSKSRATPRQR